MLEILQENAAIIISGLAVILSAAANWRTVKLNRETKVLTESLRRRDMLLEVEKCFILERELVIITTQKLKFIRFNSLLESLPSEVERLETNLKLLQQNIANQDKVRSTAELSSNTDIKLYISALTNFQRLQIKIKSDLEKEKLSFQDLKEQYANR